MSNNRRYRVLIFCLFCFILFVYILSAFSSSTIRQALFLLFHLSSIMWWFAVFNEECWALNAAFGNISHLTEEFFVQTRYWKSAHVLLCMCHNMALTVQIRQPGWQHWLQPVLVWWKQCRCSLLDMKRSEKETECHLKKDIIRYQYLSLELFCEIKKKRVKELTHGFSCFFFFF